MGSSKRQQTHAKRAREQALREKRARKDEKKQAVRDAKAAGLDPWADRLPEAEEPASEDEG
jgi:hypothetical protein